jgi:hypothetical protein
VKTINMRTMNNNYMLDDENGIGNLNNPKNLPG